VETSVLSEVMKGLFRNTRDRHGAVRPAEYTYDDSEDLVQVPRVRKDRDHPLRRRVYEMAAQVLYTRLRQTLTVPTPRERRGLRRGEVDELSIAELALGGENVFKQTVRVEQQSVAATLSWDESSSMGGLLNPRILVVKELAYTWNEGLGLIRIPTELLGWTTTRKSVWNRAAHRKCILRHRIYKDFSERWNDERVLRRLARIDTLGLTPTAEGLLFAASRLAKRPERRKLLFFATDGKPFLGANENDPIHLAFLQTVLQRCGAAGIEVVGLGIGVDLGHLFPVFVTVNSISHLKEQAADTLLHLLQASRRRIIGR
jgi:cobalamin biosynthesis protein CobT